MRSVAEHLEGVPISESCTEGIFVEEPSAAYVTWYVEFTGYTKKVFLEEVLTKKTVAKQFFAVNIEGVLVVEAFTEEIFVEEPSAAHIRASGSVGQRFSTWSSLGHSSGFAWIALGMH